MPRPVYRGTRRHQTFKQTLSPKRKHMPSSAEARSHLDSKTRHKPVGRRPSDSDDSDELVKKTNRARNRSPGELYASGAIGRGDTPGAYPTKAQRTQTMRNETREIIRSRSSSVSRASSLAAADHATPVVSKELPSTRDRSKGPIALSHTPQPDTSILGAFKPRKRQPSILQRMRDENEDSSIINTDDEEQFLPDAISTPNNTAPASKKRKRESITGNAVSAQKMSGSWPKPVLQKQHDEIMALPASSDTEDEQDVHASRGLQTSPRATKTNDLQTLMPSQRHRPKQPSRPGGSFEISEDLSSDTTPGEVEEPYSPERRRRQQQPKRNTNKHNASTTIKSSQSKAKVKPASRARKNTHKGTNETSAAASVRMDIPLPLSSSRSGNLPAKSLSFKQGDTLSDTTTHAKPAKSRERSYGGSRRRGSDKENVSSGGNDENAWSRRWADIDDYSLDFEEVTPPTSSSPMAR